SWLHSKADAEAAAARFERVHVQREAPDEIDDAQIDAGGEVHLPALIEREFGLSRSEARRLIDQGAVALGDEPLAAGEHDIPAARADGQVLRVGKRRFRRLRAG